MLDTNRFDMELFIASVKSVTVHPNGNIEAHFINGSVMQWQYTDEPIKRIKPYKRTVTECFKGKIICDNCGNAYGKMIDRHGWCKWSCQHCGNDTLRDHMLREMSAFILETDEFTEEAFLAHIEEIRVMDGRHLIFKFKDGRTKEWQGI